MNINNIKPQETDPIEVSNDDRKVFARCLAYEKSQHQKADRFYKSQGALDIERMEYDDVRFGRPKQLDDIDCVVKFYNESQPVPISEKFRRKKYDDVLFEIFSDVVERKPGWMIRSQAQRLCYFMEDQDVYEFDDLETIREICREFLSQRSENDIKKISSNTWSEFTFIYKNCEYTIPVLSVTSTGKHGGWSGACLVISFDLMKDLGIKFRHYSI